MSNAIIFLENNNTCIWTSKSLWSRFVGLRSGPWVTSGMWYHLGGMQISEIMSICEMCGINFSSSESQEQNCVMF